MKIDAQNQYSDAQAVTATAASTNSIDHGIARDLGTGQDIYLVVAAVAAMTDSGSDSTVAVTIETDSDSAFGSPLVAQTVGTFAAASPAGTVLIARLQPGAINERYTQLRYTVAGGSLTTGSFTSFLTTDIQKYVSYPKNYTIS